MLEFRIALQMPAWTESEFAWAVLLAQQIQQSPRQHQRLLLQQQWRLHLLFPVARKLYYHLPCAWVRPFGLRSVLV